MSYDMAANQGATTALARIFISYKRHVEPDNSVAGGNFRGPAGAGA